MTQAPCGGWRTWIPLVGAILGPDGTDTEDVVQESLLAFVGALPAFRGECTVLHHACRIAVRNAGSIALVFDALR